MKIVSALGGGGSSFVLRALDEYNYRPLFGIFNTYTTKVRLEKHPALIEPYSRLLRALGCYSGKLKVLKRPDSFWTDWPFHPSGIYEPHSDTFKDDLLGQRGYIVKTRLTRSAGLEISESDISTDSLKALVKSYINRMEALEREDDFTVVLIGGHWAEYGIFKDLGVETIYLIRDPFNSLISHSKESRHGKDYLKRGLENTNTIEWIDAYLTGPHHYWINFARTSLEHDNAVIVRYNRFAEDWKKIEGLPDISGEFVYSENDVAKILTPESIEYIHEKTKDLCTRLDLDTEKYLRQ
ncbi:MAG: hypothetical protein DRP65_02860 [Planctomycetota bacterium]|nr:MAG: hypothetical protein DRP65_02860 [Planctomycetota bacterium]